MSVQILTGSGDGWEYSVMYCSTTMHAFGPVFPNGPDEAEFFLKWLTNHPGEVVIGTGKDPREYDDSALATKYADFCAACQKCDSCGEYFEVVAGCEHCRPCSECPHETSLHDDEGCLICECRKGVE